MIWTLYLFNLQKKKKIWPPTTRWPRRCSMPRAAKEFSSKLHHIKIQGNKVCVYFLIVMLLVEFCNCNVLFFALLFFEKKPKRCQLYWHFFVSDVVYVSSDADLLFT